MTQEHVAAVLIDSAIRVLYNSTPQVFNEIFGKVDGPYFWKKFTEEFNSEEGSFICYLDVGRKEQFAAYVLKAMKEGRV